MIAFYLGAGDHEKADQAATQGLVLADDSWRCYDSLLYRNDAGFSRMFTASEDGH